MKRQRFITAAASASAISVLVLALAFGRQLLIAAFFGIARAIDVYFFGYAIAAMAVFIFGFVFDSVAVPRLVQGGEQSGAEAARRLAVAIFRLSWLLGAAATILMLAVTPILLPVMATGFSDGERSELVRIMFYFVPWTLLCIPYYAAAARHKSLHSYNRVFLAELVIAAMSIAFLLVRHQTIRDLPLAYAAGYAAGLATLLPGAGLLSSRGKATGIRTVARNVGEQFLATQSNNLAGVVDRHFQSLIPSGGIAAVNYVVQIINGISALMTSRDIFVVALSETLRRSEKLERLIIGLLVVAVPLTTFLSCFAHDTVVFLFQRGHFSPEAGELTASVLRIYVFVLVPSMVAAPLERMFQIIDRIHASNIFYLASSVFLAVLGYVFVIALGLGAEGIAWMALGNGVLGAMVRAYLLARLGQRIDWLRVGRYVAFSVAAAVAAGWLATIAATPISTVFGRLAIGGAVFSCVTVGCWLPLRRQLFSIFR